MENIIETVGHAADNAPTVAAAARENLERVVAKGRTNAGPVIERLLSQVPEDRVVTARALSFGTDGSRPFMSTRSGTQLGLHSNALGQAASTFGVPSKYARELAYAGGADNGWRRDLFGRVMSEHAAHAETRHLVRSIGGEARAFLSDSYGRYDCRPLLEAFVSAATRVGAVPYEGVATDLRAQVRAIIPQVFEPVPGEPMVFGLAWSNSDFGVGAYGISAFAIRLICLNGMVGESNLRRVHLGGKLPDDLRLSDATYRKNTDYLASLTRDVIDNVLSTRAIEGRVAMVRAAHAQEVDWRRGFARVSKLLTKGEAEQVKTAFEGTDEVMLPPGRTAWRFSNALSWVANGVEDPERKLELQRAAGQVVDLAAQAA